MSTITQPPTIDHASLSLPERIFQQIRQAIVEGEIPAGSKISEPELARQFGISRAPLREAIGRLEACNLVVRKPNVGARVVSLSTTDLLDLYDLRETLEGLGARLAAERMRDAEIASLRALLSDHESAAQMKRGESYYQEEGNYDFHYRIIQGSRNARLIGLLCDDLYHLLRMYRFQFGMPGPRAPHALREHKHMVEAIEQRDGEFAELLMRRHIRAARQYVKQQFANQEESA